MQIRSRLMELTGREWWAEAAIAKTLKYGGGALTTTTSGGPAASGSGAVPRLRELRLRHRILLTRLIALSEILLGQVAILSIPQMSVTMQALNEDSDAEFLANPRIVTADNMQAKIEIVRNQPVPQLNFNEQTATSVFGGFSGQKIWKHPGRQTARSIRTILLR